MASDLTRPLSGAEEIWLKGASKGSGIAVIGALFNCILDTTHVCSALQELLERHPILRAQIIDDAKGKPCFKAFATFSAEDYVTNRGWPLAVEEAESDGAILFEEDHRDKSGSFALHKVIIEELNANILNSQGKPCSPLPVFSLLVYRNLDRPQMVILMKVHGAALDRQSVSMVMKDFIAISAKAAEGKLHLAQGMKREEILPAPLEEFIYKGKASKGFLKKGLDAVGYVLSSTKYSLLPFQLSTSSSEKLGFQTRFLSISLGKEGTPIFMNACKKANVSWAAALSAALLKTVAMSDELKERMHDEFCLTIITDCRPLLEPNLAETALGNYVSAVPLGVKVQHACDVWDIARQVFAIIKKDLDKQKQISEFSVLLMLYSQVMKYPRLTWKGSMRTGLMNISVDPPLDGPCKKEAGQLDLVGTVGPLYSSNYVGACFYICECLLEGPELIFTLVYTIPLYSHAQMHHILQSAIQLLFEHMPGADQI